MRSRPEFERALLDDLAWLGLEPDATPQRQSDRDAIYRQALDQLGAQGLVYACSCSRREIAAASPGPSVESRYPGTCREKNLPFKTTAVRRIRLPAEAVRFTDLLQGESEQRPHDQCGDLLAIDRDGHWTYQFAVTVDDLEQGIDLVIRGEDLLDSTGRQVLLARMLGRSEPPRFLHHGLLRRPDGAKLSKSNRDTGVRALRAAGWTPEQVFGQASFEGGISPTASPLTLRAFGALLVERWPQLACALSGGL